MASKSEGFSDIEKQAMKDRAKEFRDARREAAKDPLKDLLTKISEMPEPDRSIATRIHELVTETAPELSPKTWYGMPAWANKEGKVICFFQSGQKFKTRFNTFGFQEAANLDDGTFWPMGYALTELTPEVEKRIAGLLRQAVS
jgi:uncharacterized protein YdhG (YjbR/CyaY superfamily)